MSKQMQTLGMNAVLRTVLRTALRTTTILWLIFLTLGAAGQSPAATPEAPASSSQDPAAAAQQSTPAPTTPTASAPADQSKSDQPKSDQTQTGQTKTDQAKPDQTNADQTKSDQTQTPASDQLVPTIKAFSNEVNVVFVVTDKHGKRITDLKQADFHVVDDNKPPEEIRSFHAEANLPLQVGLLIDASNSVRDRFKFEQESAIEFLNQTVRAHYDRAFVVGFDATPEITQDFTDNSELLAHGVHELRPGGGTALYDAIYYACRERLLKAPKTTDVRRALILLSDGDDNLSHVTREEAIEMAQRAEAIIYTISTNVSGTKGAGDKVLERIADATGGRAFFPFQIRDVANAFAEIQEELRSQYAVSYKPANFKADGHYRTIEIVANDRKNFRVRARRGYYAPAQ
jgi:VWFA-related protein